MTLLYDIFRSILNTILHFLLSPSLIDYAASRLHDEYYSRAQIKEMLMSEMLLYAHSNGKQIDSLLFAFI